MIMQLFRNAVLFVALAAGITWLSVGSPAAISMTNAQTPATKLAYAPIPNGEYKLDPAHSVVGFAIRHLEINWVEGRFKDFVGTIRYDAADITKSSVEFTAKVESIDTGIAPRDQHLRTADFFEVAKYPEMSFKSTRVERKGKDQHLLHGDFTLKGVTKQIAIPFTITGAVKDQRGNLRFGIEAHTKINRRDYGMTYGKALENGGMDIGNEVTINLYLEALQPAPKPVAGQ
jgi:polyisoprenoid-binding protein YceI